MTHLIHCEIDRTDASLRRLLGVVERRGFRIAGLELATEPAPGGGRRRVALQLSPRDPDRSLAALGRHIDRLYGVRWRPEPVAEVE